MQPQRTNLQQKRPALLHKPHAELRELSLNYKPAAAIGILPQNPEIVLIQERIELPAHIFQARLHYSTLSLLATAGLYLRGAYFHLVAARFLTIDVISEAPAIV